MSLEYYMQCFLYFFLQVPPEAITQLENEFKQLKVDFSEQKKQVINDIVFY